MTNIENIFKNQIYFQDIQEDNSFINPTINPFINKYFTYKTMLIQDPQSMYLDNADNIYRKVEPFIRYLISKHIKIKPEGCKYQVSVFNIFIIDNVENYKKIIELIINAYDGSIYLENNPDTSYTEPLKIYIDGFPKYKILKEGEEEEVPNEEEEEYEVEEEEEEEEEEDPPKVSKPFKTNQCVVCLSKEPCILFNCLHYCVCLECKNANPFRKCPSCRKQIETKVMI